MLHAPKAGCLDNDRIQSVHLVLESPALVFFHAEGLDDPVAGDGLVEHIGNICRLFLGFRAEASENPPELDDGKTGDRQNDKGKHSQFPIHIEDDAQQNDHQQKIPDDPDQGIGYGLLHQCYIRNHSGNQGPCGHLMKKGQGLGVDMIENHNPQITDDGLPTFSRRKL